MTTNTSIFDSTAFPFSDPRGRELALILAALFPSTRDVISFAIQNGIDRADLTDTSTPRQLWIDILQFTQPRGMTRHLVQAVRDAFPRNPRISFLEALLRNETVAVSADSVASVSFLSGSETVDVKEALLFRDDLTIPIGRIPTLIKSLQSIYEQSSAVCLLEVQIAGGVCYGTGFRISDELVLTNDHVALPDGQKPTSVSVTFDFELDTEGNAKTPTVLDGDTTSIVSDRDDDWAVIQVGGIPSEYGRIKIAPQVVTVGQEAFILQHPSGQRKRIGYARNTITNVTDRVVHYLTDTQQGSSGSPVFDSAGNCIALHHVGGQPTQQVGKMPLVKNEGVLISVVKDALLKRGIAI